MKVKNTCSRLIYGLIQRSMVHLENCSTRKGRVFMLHHICDNDIDFSINCHELETLLKTFKRFAINLYNLETNEKDYVAFTVDDVPEDFYINGFPIFKKYGVTFTIFVNTTLLDTPGYISTNQLKEMSECSLCTVGSHGTSHEYYRSLTTEKKHAFLRDSKQILSKLCGYEVNLFAFPYGSFYACGLFGKHYVNRYYKYGFGTVNTYITKHNILKPFFLPRININKKWIKKNLRTH